MADKTQNVKTRLSFDGEAEYKAACKEINSTLKVLNSEMKLVTAEYKDNASSVDALKAKQAVLQKTYDEQAKKVKETEAALPVGNLTSQLFANIYLDALDQFIKHELGVEAYIRYMDDFVILSPDKEQLRNWLARIEQFLREELKLEFNPKTTILAAKNGIDFVGYKHRATHRKVRKDSIKRIKRTIKKCESGKITKEQLQKSIQSWTGHAGHADSYNLRKKIETLAEAAIEKAA